MDDTGTGNESGGARPTREDGVEREMGYLTFPLLAGHHDEQLVVGVDGVGGDKEEIVVVGAKRI